MTRKEALSPGLDGLISSFLCTFTDIMPSFLTYYFLIACRVTVFSRVRCAIVVSMTLRCGKDPPAAVAVVLYPQHMHRS